MPNHSNKSGGCQTVLVGQRRGKVGLVAGDGRQEVVRIKGVALRLVERARRWRS